MSFASGKFILSSNTVSPHAFLTSWQTGLYLLHFEWKVCWSEKKVPVLLKTPQLLNSISPLQFSRVLKPAVGTGYSLRPWVCNIKHGRCHIKDLWIPGFAWVQPCVSTNARRERNSELSCEDSSLFCRAGQGGAGLGRDGGRGCRVKSDVSRLDKLAAFSS